MTCRFRFSAESRAEEVARVTSRGRVYMKALKEALKYFGCELLSSDVRSFPCKVVNPLIL